MRAADATYLYLRMRLDQDVEQSAGELKPFAWGAEFDADGVFTTYEYISHVDGISEALTWQQNTDPTPIDDPTDPAEVLLQTYTPAIDYWLSSVAAGSSRAAWDGSAASDHSVMAAL